MWSKCFYFGTNVSNAVSMMILKKMKKIQRLVRIFKVWHIDHSPLAHLRHDFLGFCKKYGWCWEVKHPVDIESVVQEIIEELYQGRSVECYVNNQRVKILLKNGTIKIRKIRNPLIL